MQKYDDEKHCQKQKNNKKYRDRSLVDKLMNSK